MLTSRKRVNPCAAAFAALCRSGVHGLRVATRSYALAPHSRLESHLAISVVFLFHNFDFKQLWPILPCHVNCFRVRILCNAVQNLVAVFALAFWVDVA